MPLHERAPRGRLFRLGALFARPRAGGVRERDARAAIDRLLRRPEDRALDGRGRHELAPRRVAVLGLRRLLVVDQAPDLLEDLLADHAGDEAEDDAERREQELHAPKGIPANTVGYPLQRDGVE